LWNLIDVDVIVSTFSGQAVEIDVIFNYFPDLTQKFRFRI